MGGCVRLWDPICLSGYCKAPFFPGLTSSNHSLLKYLFIFSENWLVVRLRSQFIALWSLKERGMLRRRWTWINCGGRHRLNFLCAHFAMGVSQAMSNAGPTCITTGGGAALVQNSLALWIQIIDHFSNLQGWCWFWRKNVSLWFLQLYDLQLWRWDKSHRLPALKL